MKSIQSFLRLTTLFLATFSATGYQEAYGTQTVRVDQFENEEVQVWKTTIHPDQPLSMHRHNNKRIVVALTDTELTVRNDRGETHEVSWKRNTAHLLQADPPGEMHVDENKSDHPMEVMVIQFKSVEGRDLESKKQ